MRVKYLFLCLFVIIISNTINAASLLDEGVSLELAQFRKTHYKDVKYVLGFSIPEDKQAIIYANAEVHLVLEKQVPVILDFTGSAGDIKKLLINGQSLMYAIENKHIVVSEDKVSSGKNIITIEFIAGNQSLNRRDDFVYTLLVPDRARTLFPCFDQPNLKARFNLELEVPVTWEAIGNGSADRIETVSNEKKSIRFRETEPISTYLFSFVAGKFDKVEGKKGDRSVTLYHRETDPNKISQCNDIMDEVFQSLEWMEEYTDVPYPFEKYDLIILPGFQFGGMEHMGATLYNDRRMFLEQNATPIDSLGRSSLIAHETAHMWFGDYVTMEWFNDVWNKEVFANWFAAQIVEPMYPHINQELNFIISYYPSAYSEDRTGGSTPIQQPLDNLRNAGLIYSNVVYNKSPVIMEMLIEKIGREKYREAIREYLKKYAYGNSDWDGLISILDSKTEDNLRAWSDIWVKGKGMPAISVERDSNKLNIKQSDLWGMGRIWPLDFTVMAYDEGLVPDLYEVKMNGSSRISEIMLTDKNDYILPGCDGKGYGYFKTDPQSTEWMLKNWDKFQQVTRFSVLMNLYEGVMHNDIEPEAFLKSIMLYTNKETDPRIFRQILAYAGQCIELFIKPGHELRDEYEDYLFRMADGNMDAAFRTLALKSFAGIASSKTSLERLYYIWNTPSEATRYRVSESDLIEYSYMLAVHFPEKADEILKQQLSQITNPDRRKEYEFVMQALTPLKEQRQAFFDRLMLPESWAVEPWAQTALRWLNHPVRYPESLDYIRPALDRLYEIQRVGDIFFPTNWCSALLSGHTSPEALNIVDNFFTDHPDYPALLKSKIRQRADHLYVVNQPERRYSINVIDN